MIRNEEALPVCVRQRIAGVPRASCRGSRRAVIPAPVSVPPCMHAQTNRAEPKCRACDVTILGRSRGDWSLKGRKELPAQVHQVQFVTIPQNTPLDREPPYQWLVPPDPGEKYHSARSVKRIVKTFRGSLAAEIVLRNFSRGMKTAVARGICDPAIATMRSNTLCIRSLPNRPATSSGHPRRSASPMANVEPVLHADRKGLFVRQARGGGHGRRHGPARQFAEADAIG